MSRKVSAQRKVSESGEDLCAVCSEVVGLYAVGQCDHFVCYRCCTRMRSLCEQMYCAICRTELPKVALVRKLQKFADINTSHFLINRAIKVYFENERAQESFNKLLEYKCTLCSESKPLRTFPLLKDHMRKEHDMYYCDLCVKHLKLFSHERKFYSRKGLTEHRTTGDPDDHSHKGHPLCEFCMLRYLDNDELARHLRKEHYYCHFCDADGISNQFYSDYTVLKEHFRKSHYLCTEGECAYSQFTNAFRTDIDLQAHTAAEHSRNLRRSQQKQARTLELDFNYAPRQSAPNRRDRRNEYVRSSERVITGADYLEVYESQRPSSQQHKTKRQQRAPDRENEDTARAIAASINEAKSKGHINVIDSTLLKEKGKQKTVKEEYNENSKDFPTLDGKVLHQVITEEETSKVTDKNFSDTMAKKVARANKFSVRDGNLDSQSFPVLGNQTTAVPPPPPSSNASAGAVMKKTNKPNVSNVAKTLVEDFPALGISRKPQPVTNNWVGKSNTVKTVHTASVNAYPTLGSIGGSLTKTQPVSTKPAKSTKDSKSGKKHTATSSTDFDFDFTLEKSNSLVKEDLNLNPKVRSPNPVASNVTVITEKSDENVSVPIQNYTKPVIASSKDFPSLGKSNTSTAAPTMTWGPSKTKAKKVENSENTRVKENTLMVSKVKNKKSKAESKKVENSIESSNKDESSTYGGVSKENISNCDESVSRENVETFQDQSDVNSYSALKDHSNLQKESTSFKVDDFPSLSLTSTPPGFSKQPPPGFGNKPNKAPPAKPPPGFGALSSMVSNTSLEKENNEISDNQAQVSPQFIQPQNALKRNQCLISAIQEHVNNDNDLFSEFKSCSGKFRTGEIGAYDYYDRCSNVLGKENFKSIFSELLTLLPDIGKQQELLSAHNTALKLSKCKKSGGRGKKLAVWSTGEQLPFSSCVTCGQIVNPSDVPYHQKEHNMDSDFPSLS